MSSAVSNAELAKAYRQLYRSGLRAIQFSKPARYVLRDQLRAAFRGQRTRLTSEANNAATPKFDAEAVRRTVWFFNAAAASRETEHHVVQNLLITAFFRRRRAQKSQPTWTLIQNASKSKITEYVPSPR